MTAGLRAAAARWPERTGRSRVRAKVESVTEAGLAAGVGAAICGVALLAGLIIFARLGEAADYVTTHTSAVAVGLGLAVAALTLLAAMVAALRPNR